MDAERLATVVGGLSADAALGGGRVLRATGPRPQLRAERGDPRQPDLAFDARERRADGLRWGQTQEGLAIHLAVDTLGLLLALHVTLASADDRSQVGRLAEAMQAATSDSVDLAYVNYGYTGERPAKATREHSIELEVVKLPEAKRGFVLLPRRRVVERSFAWATRFRRLVKDYERYLSTPPGLHIVAFVCAMLKQAARLAGSS